MKKLLFAAFALLAVRARADDPQIHRNLPYAGFNNEKQTLDVYAPATGKNHAVVLWIHGGGWKYGDKADLQHGARDPSNRKAQCFVTHGYVLVAINYRLVPAVTVGEMAGDVAKSIRWVHEHAQEYGGDPNAIFVMGHSAGAQLAALVCTDRAYIDAEGLTLNCIKGCVPVDGDTYYPELQIDIEPRLANVNAYLLEFPTVISQKSLSSVLHVFKGKRLPPFLIIHVADHPETHTQMQSQILAESLRQAEIPARLYSAPGKTHDTLNADIGLPDDGATQAILTFIAEQMTKSG